MHLIKRLTHSLEGLGNKDQEGSSSPPGNLECRNVWEAATSGLRGPSHLRKCLTRGCREAAKLRVAREKAAASSTFHVSYRRLSLVDPYGDRAGKGVWQREFPGFRVCVPGDS